jgi:hypothetical protein
MKFDAASESSQERSQPKPEPRTRVAHFGSGRFVASVDRPPLRTTLRCSMPTSFNSRRSPVSAHGRYEALILERAARKFVQ